MAMTAMKGKNRSQWNGCMNVAMLCCHARRERRREVAQRIVMAASRSLGIMAECMILLSFAAEHRKLYWTGSKKVAMEIFQSNYCILALVILY